jgi:hypothetical protein
MDIDDPIVASYNVFLTKPGDLNKASANPSSASDRSPKVLVLQYPAFRPSSKPYNAAKSQQPSELRLKPKTGLIEIDVPLLTQENYNADLGERYGKAMTDSKTLHAKSSHGLAGGFYAGSGQSAPLQQVPAFSDPNPTLTTQTLGGKIVEPGERDPVYFLGIVKDGSMHLSHVEGVVQVRPQLHHLDAEEQLNDKRFQAQSGPRAKAGADAGPSKLESRAVEMKLKDTKEETRDRNLNENAKLLREIQMDTWQTHKWADQDNDAALDVMSKLATVQTSIDSGSPQLKSALSNGDWLDRMSAPRENGKKGLLAKLRGRERERARRKKAEEEKKLKAKAPGDRPPPGTGALMEQSSDSEASSQAATDNELEPDLVPLDDDIEIKEEPESSARATRGAQNTASGESDPKPAKKRGRPKKPSTVSAMDLDDG